MKWLKSAARMRGPSRSKCPSDGTGGRDRRDKLLRRVSDEEGASLVETALACTILLAVLVGAFDMCLATYTAHTVSRSAREATRYAIVRGSQCVNLTGCGASNTDIQNYVRGFYPGLITNTTWYTVTMNTAVTPNTAVLTLCGTAPAGCNLPGNQVQVQVSAPFSFTIPFYGSKTPTLTSTSAMVISQ